MAKKKLQDAISSGIDKLFSVNDTQEAQATEQAQETQDVVKAQKTVKTHKAEQVQKTIEAYAAAEAQKARLVSGAEQAAEAADAAPDDIMAAQEARRTMGRKGYKMQRMNISLTPKEYDFVRIMAAVAGKSMTVFIGDLIDEAAERNADTYAAAKQLLAGIRK